MKSLLIGPMLLLAACGTKPPASMAVSSLVAQPLNAARTSVAVYMTVTPTCSAPDVLEGVTTQSPATASLVATSDVDVKLVVTPVTSIAIDCTKPTVLKPMASHVLVSGLARPAAIGDKIPLTLRFKNAGNVAVTAEISSLAVLENVDPMNMRKHHQHMPGMDMNGMNMSDSGNHH